MIGDSKEREGFLFSRQKSWYSIFVKAIKRLRLSETHQQIMLLKVNMNTFEITLVVFFCIGMYVLQEALNKFSVLD